MLSLLAISAADISLSRTINAVSSDYISTAKATIDGDACTASDDYGSNNCVLSWGSTYTAHLELEQNGDITQGSTFAADFKLDRFIPFKFSCALCGANCSITVPIIRKTVSFTLPDCPISGLSFDNTTDITLPADPGLPQTSVSGSVTAKGATGTTIADISIDGKITATLQDMGPVIEEHERASRIGKTLTALVKLLIGVSPTNVRVRSA